MEISIVKKSDQREGIWYEVTIDKISTICNSLQEVTNCVLQKTYEYILKNA